MDMEREAKEFEKLTLDSLRLLNITGSLRIPD
jgi:hypothetical protein